MVYSRQTILMCAPDYFGVEYVINPWMQNQIGKTDAKLATQQWNHLRDALAKHADIAYIPPQQGLPDMVFTANAGLVLGDKVIISHFHSKERQGEEPFLKTWFQENGFSFDAWPQDISFEGAGDALIDRLQPMIWMGYGFRSDSSASAYIETIVGRRVVKLKLVNPYFYHVDTCLCPLEGGYMLYYPPAFDAASQEKIKMAVPDDKRIAVSEEDATHFACNAVNIDNHIFANFLSDELQNQLREVGFTPVVTPLTEFLKSGGGAKCLTLKLVEA